MWILERYRTRRAISRWCKDYKKTAATILHQAATDLVRDIDPLLREADWWGRLLQDRFIAERVAPRVRSLVEPVVARIIEDANRSLARLTTHRIPWPDPPPAAPPPDRGEDAAATAPPPIGEPSPGVTLPEPGRSYARLQRKARRYIHGALIAGSGRQPSILMQLKALFDEAAGKARRG